MGTTSFISIMDMRGDYAAQQAVRTELRLLDAELRARMDAGLAAEDMAAACREREVLRAADDLLDILFL